jgi:thiaminase (transcriptional activator TenA)
MTSFSDTAWQRTARLRQAIHELPFNTELAAGSLSRARFQGYVIQDALYLGQYSRVLAIAGVKGPDGATLHAFAESALEAVAVEQALHARYLREFGIDPARLADAEPSPDCLGYTSFLLATGYHDPWEVLVAALLPCFWVYWTWAAKFPNERRQRIRTGRGSTHTLMRASAKQCARSSASPTAPLRTRHPSS